MRLPKLANWLSDGDLEKYQQQAQQASVDQSRLERMESELEKYRSSIKQTEKELEQAKAQLQINQGFQIELGETQLALRTVNDKVQNYKKELFEKQKQLNLLQSQLNQAKQSLSRSQNWTQYIKTPIKVVDIKKTLPKEDFEALWGFGILFPNVNFVVARGALVIKGWVLGKKSDVTQLNVIHQGEQILSTEVKMLRPKIVEQYPDIPTASRCGFEFALSVAGIPGEVEITLEAVLEDSSVVPLCAIFLQPNIIESKDT